MAILALRLNYVICSRHRAMISPKSKVIHSDSSHGELILALGLVTMKLKTMKIS